MDLWKVIGIEDIYDYRLWSTKEFFDYSCTKRRFLEAEHWKYTELVEGIKNGKAAVFPVSADVRMEEVINTSKLGLQVYMVQFKAYKELKKHYIADAVEGQTDTEQ